MVTRRRPQIETLENVIVKNTKAAQVKKSEVRKYGLIGVGLPSLVVAAEILTAVMPTVGLSLAALVSFGATSFANVKTVKAHASAASYNETPKALSLLANLAQQQANVSKVATEALLDADYSALTHENLAKLAFLSDEEREKAAPRKQYEILRAQAFVALADAVESGLEPKKERRHLELIGQKLTRSEISGMELARLEGVRDLIIDQHPNPQTLICRLSLKRLEVRRNFSRTLRGAPRYLNLKMSLAAPLVIGAVGAVLSGGVGLAAAASVWGVVSYGLRKAPEFWYRDLEKDLDQKPDFKKYAQSLEAYEAQTAKMNKPRICLNQPVIATPKALTSRIQKRPSRLP